MDQPRRSQSAREGSDGPLPRRGLNFGIGGSGTKGVGIGSILALFAFCGAGAACSGDEALPAGTVLVTFGQEAEEWGKVARLRVEAISATTSRTLFDGAVEAAAIELGETGAGATITLTAEARDLAGAVIARGRTSSFSGSELPGATVPLLLSPIGGASRASAGLLTGRERNTSGGSVLLRGRYALLTGTLADGAEEELYDSGLLSTLLGGPTWPRAPSSLLAATTHDLLVVDDTGASLVDVFASTPAVTTSLAAADAIGLVFGQVLEGARAADAPDTPTGRWLAGPCRRARPGATASDRVLFLDESDQLVVVRLAAPRLGASCAVGVNGSLLIAGGGVDTLTAIDPAGSVTDIPLPDDRTSGAALVDEGGALLLLGGRTAAGAVAAPVRVAFPCAQTCIAEPASFGALGTDAALLDLEALPTSRGRAFFLAEGASAARVFVGRSTAIETSLAELTARRPRSGADAFVLAGERLLLAGGRDASGLVLDVEILTPR